MKTIHLIAAARPNFMKIAPLYHALNRTDWADPVIVHTGQHYDINMSDAFFTDFRLPDPHIHLGVGSGTHAQQTGRVMIAYEEVLMKTPPDLVVVVGDVNSTVAATLAAVKLGIPTAHLEAGLRSFDRTMPEEINRLATDALADLLWTPSPDGDENLKREGVPPEKIERVGNIMIDSLEMLRGRIEAERIYRQHGLGAGGYGLITLHRPSNVDDPEVLGRICGIISNITEKLPCVFPVHPRTRKNLETFGLMAGLEALAGLRLLSPLSYIPFMNLVFHSRLLITDSGGVQEESTYLGIPCLTLRPNTERPVTVTEGSNRLCTPADLEAHVNTILDQGWPKGRIPSLWDGKTADRVVASIRRYLDR
ncbi:non-hydrolyzing UDP-N-acetylglucosamine 2-epimerase [Desulfococcus sp.]|uniref:non-hydrolyzing UDP-N-acetylglucosamine 2-epimerase n=1 Tax=Desulfococcus sp. TaxID=2025834 RepID=UPI0035939D64